MPASKSANVVRAIAVVGPTGAGKTALTQALASAASGGSGAVPTAAGQSTETAFTAIDFMGDHYALIDTPGSVDFLADADYAIPAADLAVVVADPELAAQHPGAPARMVWLGRIFEELRKQP